MAELKLTQDRVAYVDDADFDKVCHSNWFLHNEGYAVRNIVELTGRYPNRTEYLQQAILEPPPGYQIRFKDGNRLNCSRSNLELLTISDARRAARPRKNASSKYKGVGFHKQSGKWRAMIRADGVPTYLGCFAEEEAAARAYDAAARRYFGPVAYLNFPDETEATNQTDQVGSAGT